MSIYYIGILLAFDYFHYEIDDSAHTINVVIEQID
jgi:hypothetical protein